MSLSSSPALGAFRITGGRTFYEAQAVEIIDQLALPHTIRWELVDTVEGAFDAIKTMKVRSLYTPAIVFFTPLSDDRDPAQIRGAPAIASLAALGLAAELLALQNGREAPSFAQSLLSGPPQNLLDRILDRSAYLYTSRPTAVNLREALHRIEAAAKAEAAREGATADSLAKKVVEVAVGVWVEDKERCERIGNNGAKWILEKLEREGKIAQGEKIAVLTVRPSSCLDSLSWESCQDLHCHFRSPSRPCQY